MKIKSRNNKLYLHFAHDGKFVRKSLKLEDTFKNRTLVKKQIIPEIQKQLVLGEFFEEKEEKPTVDEFVKLSFSLHKHHRRELTQKKYEDIYRLHIQPTFGHKQIDKIKRAELFLWQNKLLDTRTGKTVVSIRTVLMSIFEDAYKEEIIEKNYLKLVDPPKVVETREKKPFTVEEMYTILDNAPEHIRAYFAIGFFAGLRTGEIIALRWQDIDFENWMIYVRHSIRAGLFTAPKTKASIRDIEIIDALKPYLIAHREQASDESVFLFETYVGKPYARSDKISSHYWKAILKEHNIPYRNLYQMRHTFASQMLMNGEDILWTSQMLGHKDSTMTLEKYARYIPQKNVKRASFLDR
ncbi:tyrosine-type recombinase/integrase [Sulfurimonas microaerophilic]|uniref:tyrosine-type recombinase/integrase n=1 Tax=Sulfurimonas microaerophilic TaxID=3058392 RepID=UPI0027146B09|nr:site-specific integrase [Sulfurimonas sp. hsl 1-7]